MSPDQRFIVTIVAICASVIAILLVSLVVGANLTDKRIIKAATEGVDPILLSCGVRPGNTSDVRCALIIKGVE